MKLRDMSSKDRPHMEEFLYQAIFVPPGTEPFSREIIFRPDMIVYFDGFDPEINNGDCGILAEDNGKIVGMAWVRLINGDGYVDDKTPILSISLLSEYRGQGIGTSIMKRIFDLIKERGFHQTSLSVQAANPAQRLYQRLGYEIHEIIHGNVEVWTMLKRL